MVYVLDSRGYGWSSAETAMSIDANAHVWTPSFSRHGVLVCQRCAAVCDPSSANVHTVCPGDPIGEAIRHARDVFGSISKVETEHPTPINDAEKRINDVIDDLSARKVGDVDRFRLRGALDKADKPLEGREGADAGLGNAIGRSRSPFAAAVATW